MQCLHRPTRVLVSLLAAGAVGCAAAPAAAATAPVAFSLVAPAASLAWQPPVYQTLRVDGWFQSRLWAPLATSARVQTMVMPAGAPLAAPAERTGTAASGSGAMRQAGRFAVAAPRSSTQAAVWVNWSAAPVVSIDNPVASGAGTGMGATVSGSGTAGGSVAPSGSPANETTAAHRIFGWTNQTRAQHGLPPLAQSSLLDKVALAKCQDMINQGYFADNSPTFGSPLQMQQAFGVRARIMGAENIAGAATPQLAYFMLTASAPHLANILYPGLTDIGVAVVPDGVYGVYVCQEFIGN